MSSFLSSKNLTCTNITRGVFDHLALGVVCPEQFNNVNLDRTKLALVWTSSIFVLLTYSYFFCPEKVEKVWR